ncbi:MAG TPA: hypothetical protein VNQ79_23240 [Blastocatellia bacterium]|nr:hypothetical protein [Blastocatellia bacterium]
MSENLIEEISEKSAALPLDQQREVLDFVEFMLHKSEKTKQRIPYRSTRGLFANSGVKITDEDIAEVRREMWANFPREEPR